VSLSSSLTPLPHLSPHNQNTPPLTLRFLCPNPPPVSPLRRGFDHDTGIVKLRMAGSCVGCPSSTATLRGGVENMLMHYIPEVRGIESVDSPLDALGKKELKELESKLPADA
jgi:hypothetical protein